jgi:hypothetical protein
VLGPLEGAYLSPGTQHSRCRLSHLRTETSQFPKRCFFQFLRLPLSKRPLKSSTTAGYIFGFGIFHDTSLARQNLTLHDTFVTNFLNTRCKILSRVMVTIDGVLDSILDILTTYTTHKYK